MVNTFIITPYEGKLYSNTKMIGDKEVFLSTGIEGHQTVNRYAVVKSVPTNYSGPIKDGNFLVVHHNVFRKAKNFQGVEHFSTGHLGDDEYMVETVEVFAYRVDMKDDWIPIEPYCFVEPIEDLSGKTNKNEVELHGVMKYGNSILENRGVHNGDAIVFTPDSEYEFNLDGVKLYKMNSNNICLKI